MFCLGTVAVIPAFNEELTIGTVVTLTKQHVDMVVVVDDGSEDRTARVASLCGAHVISLEKNQGKAAAVLAGFNYVLEQNYRIVVMLDADGQNNPEQIPVLLQPIIDKRADLVIGSRFLNRGEKIPLYRRFGQKVLNRATNVGSSHKVSDTQSGFRALNKIALETMIKISSDGYGIETDMINIAFDSALDVMEVPISVRYDVPNGHKKNFLTHGVGLFGNIINSLTYRRPLLFFGSIGALFLSIGAAIFLGSLLELPFMMWSSWPLWSLSFFVSGVITLLVALMLNAQAVLKNEMMIIHSDLLLMKDGGKDQP